MIPDNTDRYKVMLFHILWPRLPRVPCCELFEQGAPQGGGSTLQRYFYVRRNLFPCSSRALKSNRGRQTYCCSTESHLYSHVPRTPRNPPLVLSGEAALPEAMMVCSRQRQLGPNSIPVHAGRPLWWARNPAKQKMEWWVVLCGEEMFQNVSRNVCLAFLVNREVYIVPLSSSRLPLFLRHFIFAVLFLAARYAYIHFLRRSSPLYCLLI